MEMIFIIIILLTNGKTTHAAMEIPSQLKSTQLFVNKAGPCRHLNNNNDDDDAEDNDDDDDDDVDVDADDDGDDDDDADADKCCCCCCGR